MSVYPDRAKLEAIRDAAQAALLDSLTNPKPSYSIDGQRVDWTQYRKGLQESLDWATATLKEIDAAESGPGYEESLTA